MGAECLVRHTLYFITSRNFFVVFERGAYSKRNLVREPAGPPAFTLQAELKLVGPSPSILRPFITQSLQGWQEANAILLPAEAQGRMQEGTQT